jgi:hypothetical protein
MIDKLLYKFFAWIDSLVEKIQNVLTFNIGQKPPKKRKTRKCKYCHCKCHCKNDLHLHEDKDLCTCDNCKC